MVRRMRRSGDPIPGGALVSRRGARGFAGRFVYQVSGTRAKPVLSYGSASRYAAMLALGGTIVPRKAKALTIPIAPEARGKRARDFPGIFRIGDILFIAKARGRGRGKHTELIPLFVLKRRVTIPAFDWGYRWDESDERALIKSLRRQLEAVS